MNKFISISCICIGIIGCQSKPMVRDLTTDPVTRIFIDPNIPAADYVEIRRALVQSRKFQVVERREGFDLALREKALQHGHMSGQFSDKEKWAWVGEMLGARAAVTGAGQCYQEKDLFGRFMRKCKQDLVLIDLNTGEDVLAVNGFNSIPWTVEWVVPDWNETIGKLVEAYPKYFETKEIHPVLENYKEQSQVRSTRVPANSQ